MSCLILKLFSPSPHQSGLQPSEHIIWNQSVCKILSHFLHLQVSVRFCTGASYVQWLPGPLIAKDFSRLFFFFRRQRKQLLRRQKTAKDVFLGDKTEFRIFSLQIYCAWMRWCIIRALVLPLFSLIFFTLGMKYSSYYLRK